MNRYSRKREFVKNDGFRIHPQDYDFQRQPEKMHKERENRLNEYNREDDLGRRYGRNEMRYNPYRDREDESEYESGSRGSRDRYYGERSLNRGSGDEYDSRRNRSYVDGSRLDTDHRYSSSQNYESSDSGEHYDRDAEGRYAKNFSRHTSRDQGRARFGKKGYYAYRGFNERSPQELDEDEGYHKDGNRSSTRRYSGH